MTSDQTLIANKFNDFFSNVGSKLTQNLGKGGVENFINYLSNPRLINLTFELVSEDDIKELINNLPSKPSCGHDRISNKLLKACNQEICKPLTLIVNQIVKYSRPMLPETNTCKTLRASENALWARLRQLM